MQLTSGEQASIFIKCINMTAASWTSGSGLSKSTCGTCLSRQFESPSTVAEPNWEAEAGAADAQCGRWEWAGLLDRLGAGATDLYQQAHRNVNQSPRKQTNSLCLNARDLTKALSTAGQPQFSVLLFKKKPSLSDLVSSICENDLFIHILLLFSLRLPTFSE